MREAVTHRGTDSKRSPDLQSRPVSPMWELDREIDTTPSSDAVAVIGRGRLGRALAAALGIAPPLGRGAPPPSAMRAVILAVPDDAIAPLAAALAPGPAIGHCAGALGLEALEPHAERFSLHPLMTLTPASGAADLRGAGAAIAGSTPGALALAGGLARRAGLEPFTLADADRALYHAAASVASNFLITLEGAAERLFACRRRAAPRRAPRAPSLENWVALGAERALTGPIARGDLATVSRQREAIAGRAPDLLVVYDALAGRDQEVRRRMMTLRTVAAVREALGAPGAATGRARADDGRAPRGPPVAARAGARASAATVVMSLFVNPTQFGTGEDLARYPRDEERDAGPGEEAGVDLLFAPALEEMYPPGFATTVVVAGLSEPLEGAARGAEPLPRRRDRRREAPQHRRPGRRLLRPEGRAAGARDPRMARDLDIPGRIEVCPTVREPDGLARSSRNALSRRGGPRPRRRRSRARSARPPRWSARASAAAPRSSAAARDELPATRSSPTTSPSSTPRRSRRSTASNGPCSSPSPRGSAGPPDRQRHRHPGARRARHDLRRSRMSTTPKTSPTADPGRMPVTLPRLAEKKRLREPIVMVTAYDFPSGQVADAAGADIVLVGDSGAEVVLGYDSTVAVSVDEMLMLTAATRRGVASALLVADLPFGSYEISDEQAIATAQRFVKEARADAVKLEGGGAAQCRGSGRSSAPGSRSWATSG